MTRHELIDALDSPTIAALAQIFSDTQTALSKSYSAQVADILAPRLCNAPAQDAVQTEQMRSSGPAEQSGSGTWTAGIDIIRSYPFQDTQWHLHAIEFHHKVRQEAEALRDQWLSAMTEGDRSRDPAVVAAVQQALMRHPFFEGNSAIAFGFANTAIDAYRIALSSTERS